MSLLPAGELPLRKELLLRLAAVVRAKPPGKVDETALGIRAHAHRWRHTCAQAMLDSGMDRESVRALLGHEGYATVATYTRATDLNRALDQHRHHSPADRLPLRSRRR